MMETTAKNLSAQRGRILNPSQAKGEFLQEKGPPWPPDQTDRRPPGGNHQDRGRG